LPAAFDELDQLPTGSPAIDDFRSVVPTFEHVPRVPGHEQGCGSIEQYGIPFGAAFFASQNAPNDRRIQLAVSSAKIRQAGRLDRENIGRQL
jgi:hypothetical protein